MLRLTCALLVGLIFSAPSTSRAQTLDELIERLRAQRQTPSADQRIADLEKRTAAVEKDLKSVLALLEDMQRTQKLQLSINKQTPALTLPKAPLAQLAQLAQKIALSQPPGIARPSWMTPYAKATIMPDGSKISNSASKWHQPGGLEGLNGWTSKLFKWVAGGSTWKDGAGIMRRQYADGTVFEDELSYNNTVFERRAREKINGQWFSEVIYTNKSARPPGYKSIGEKACASCHAVAGLAGVPGGDGVLSDKFAELE